MRRSRPPHSRSPARQGPLRLLGAALLAFEAALALSTGYLLGLLVAARATRGGSEEEAGGETKGELPLTVLIPAHDEEDGIEATLTALARCEYPDGLRRTIVIADNCGDRTAERARRAGAEVWERQDADQARKGSCPDLGFRAARRGRPREGAAW